MEQNDHFYLPLDKICKKEGEVSIKRDKMHPRNIIIENGSNMYLFDKFDNKFIGLQSKKRNVLS